MKELLRNRLTLIILSHVIYAPIRSEIFRMAPKEEKPTVNDKDIPGSGKTISHETGNI